LVIAPGQPKTPQAADADRILDALLEAMAPSEAARLAAKITGLPRRGLYQKALARAK
jgi:16S rRNA (cytidine1402-2'-O)-methyltransferase